MGTMYNGVGTEIGLQEYLTYVIPTPLHGLEALVLGESESNIPGKLPPTVPLAHTAYTAVYSSHIHPLTGISPVRALIIIRSLSFFRNIAN